MYLDIVEVESNRHDNGKRGVQSVVVVEVIVYERAEYILVVVGIEGAVDTSEHLYKRRDPL